MSEFELRPYQTRIIGNILDQFQKVQRTLAVAATGTGKTVLFCTLADMFIKKELGRVMILAHRDELIEQACKKVRAITGVIPSVEKADQWSDEDNIHGKPPIVVSSVQTQNTGRMNRFPAREFSLLVIDEFHHAMAASYRKIIDHYMSNKNCKLLGVTATPERGDGELLGEVVDSVADVYSLQEAVEDGYLVPVHPVSIEIAGLDFSKIHTVAGDFNQGELEAAMLFEEPLHGIAHATIEIACDLPQGTLNRLRDDTDRAKKLAPLITRPPRKSLVFAVSIEHATRQAEIFNRWIPDSADVIHSKLSMEDRKTRLKAFTDGRLRFLSNVGIATEGYDEPSVEMVVMGRPTKSRGLYCQMLGRGTRPLEIIAHQLGTLLDADGRRQLIAASAKPMLRVLDFVGNSDRHEIVSTVDIFGAGYEPEEIENAKKYADGGHDAQEALELSREELDTKKREAEQRKKDKEERLRKEAEASSRQQLVGTASYKIRQELTWDAPPDWAKEIPANYIRVLKRGRVPVEDIKGLPHERIGKICQKIMAHAEMGLCTYRQAKYLVSHGFGRDDVDRMTFDAASKAISEYRMNAKPSEKQQRCLLRAGYSEAEVMAMNPAMASAAIDELAKNGWKRRVA